MRTAEEFSLADLDAAMGQEPPAVSNLHRLRLNPHGLNVLRPSAWLNRTAPERRWIVDGILPVGAVTMLNGESEQLERVAVLQQALALALQKIERLLLSDDCLDCSPVWLRCRSARRRVCVLKLRTVVAGRRIRRAVRRKAVEAMGSENPPSPRTFGRGSQLERERRGWTEAPMLRLTVGVLLAAGTAGAAQARRYWTEEQVEAFNSIVDALAAERLCTGVAVNQVAIEGWSREYRLGVSLTDPTMRNELDRAARLLMRGVRQADNAADFCDVIKEKHGATSAAPLLK